MPRSMSSPLMPCVGGALSQPLRGMRVPVYPQLDMVLDFSCLTCGHPLAQPAVTAATSVAMIIVLIMALSDVR